MKEAVDSVSSEPPFYVLVGGNDSRAGTTEITNPNLYVEPPLTSCWFHTVFGTLDA